MDKAGKGFKSTSLKKMKFDNGHLANALRFGSIVVLNINDAGDYVDNLRLFTQHSLSKHLTVIQEDNREYDVNSLFMIVPKAQYQSIAKIHKIINSGHFEKDLQQDFDSLNSEKEYNVDLQELHMGNPLKYNQSFQLMHINSQRLLSYTDMNPAEIKRVFRPDDDNDRQTRSESDGTSEDQSTNFVDSTCNRLGFSYYPSASTHFKIVEASPFQNDTAKGEIYRDHYFYLSSAKKGK